MEQYEEYLEDLGRLVARRQAMDADIAVCVAAARAAGVTWSQIGAALGLTKAGAHWLYGRTPDKKAQDARTARGG